MSSVSDYVNVIIRADASGVTKVLRGVAAKLRRIAVGAQQVGVAFAVMAAAAAKAIKNVLDLTTNLDDSLRTLAARMAVDFDGEEFQGLKKDLEGLGGVMPLTTTEVVKLATEFATLGFKGRENLAMLTEQAVMFSRAAGISAEEAAQAIGNAVNMFTMPDGMKDEARYMADVMLYMQNNSAATVEATGESWASMGNLYEKMGVTFSQMNAEIMASSNANVKGSKAGRKGVAALINMLTVGSDTAKKFGVDIEGDRKSVV